MTRYRDMSAVPDWALLTMMVAAIACGREQGKVGPDERASSTTTTTPNDATVSNAVTIRGGARVDVTPS